MKTDVVGARKVRPQLLLGVLLLLRDVRKSSVSFLLSNLLSVLRTNVHPSTKEREGEKKGEKERDIA